MDELEGEADSDLASESDDEGFDTMDSDSEDDEEEEDDMEFEEEDDLAAAEEEAEAAEEAVRQVGRRSRHLRLRVSMKPYSLRAARGNDEAEEAMHEGGCLFCHMCVSCMEEVLHKVGNALPAPWVCARWSL